MKNFALMVVMVFGLTLMVGCGKKKSADESAELNGVTTDNLVSLSDSSLTDADSIPVVIENAEAMIGDTANDVSGNVVAVVGEVPSTKQIQQALKNAGVYTGKIDGTIGPRTKKAIETFQSQNGLKADGKVGRKTWSALSAYLNKPMEVTNPSADSQIMGQ